MNYIYLFPGQGAQYPQMGKDLYDHNPAVRDLFRAAQTEVGFDVADLIFNGTAEELQATDKTQIAVTLVNLAAAQGLQTAGISPIAVAGFSLGEYAAMVTAGILTVADALQAVRIRGAIMEEVSRKSDSDAGKSGLTAIIGISIDEVAQCIDSLHSSEVYIAIKNSPAQTVIGGTYSGLRAAEKACEAAGALRIIPLRVSGPFHTPHMEEARREYEKELATISFSDPHVPIYSNVTAERVRAGNRMRELAAKQLVSVVEWVAEQRALIADSAQNKHRRLLEVGPGSVLRGLWRGLLKEMRREISNESDRELLPECLPVGKIEEIASLT